MTTQQTADHEQPDRELPMEERASVDSEIPVDETPHSKKNWDRKTRRRHAVSTGSSLSPESTDPSESTESAELADSVESPEPTEPEPTSVDYELEPESISAELKIDSIAPAQEQEPEHEQELEQEAEQEFEQETESKQELEPESKPETEPDPELAADDSLQADSNTASQEVGSTETQQPDKSEELREQESGESLTEEREEELSVDPTEEPTDESAEELVEELAEEAVEELVEEPADEPAEELAKEPVEELIEELVEEPAEESIEMPVEEIVEAEEAEDFEFVAAETVNKIEMSAQPQALPHDQVPAQRQSWKAKRHAQAKQTYREERRAQVPDPGEELEPPAESSYEAIRQVTEPQPSQPKPTKQPTKRKRSADKPAESQPAQPYKQQKQQQLQAECQAQQEPPYEQQQPQQQRQLRDQKQQHEQQKQQRQQQRKPQKQRHRSQRYLQSSSLKQAFHNLLKLNGGAAWRETRYAIVTFFVLFGLLALAVADTLPAIDAFNAAVNSAIHSTRGSLDTIVITLTTLGDFLPMAVLCLAVCLILYFAKKWDSLAFFVVNVVLALVCVQALKLIFAVPRPTEETLVPLPISFSFPSAHSFCSLIVLGMIGLLIFRALIRRGVSDRTAMIPGIILVIFAILIGISRIYVGVHWPSDVLGGWLLAGIWLSYSGALYTAGARQPISNKR